MYVYQHCNLSCVAVINFYTYILTYFNFICSNHIINYVTEFAKRGLIHPSDFPTLKRHNFILKQAIRLKGSVLLVQ